MLRFKKIALVLSLPDLKIQVEEALLLLAKRPLVSASIRLLRTNIKLL